MQIVLVRHGIAEDVTAGSTQIDADRRLTKKGRKQMKRVAKGLRRVLGEIDLIATSPYTRAVQTADILYKEFSKEGAPVLEQVDALKSGASGAAVKQWLLTKDSACTLMLVGHEPDLSTLMAYLTSGGGAYAKLGKAGACLIDSYSHDTAKGKLLWLCTPAMFKWLGV